MDNRFAAGTTYRRRKRRRFNPTRLIVFAIAILAVYISFTIIKKQGEAVGFCEGVYVNGTHMSGMSYEEGLRTVSDRLEERLNDSTYELRYQEKKYTITATQLGAKVDRPIEELVSQAWNYGRSGNWFERRSEIQSLKQESVYLESAIEFDGEMIKKATQILKSRVDKEPVDAQITQSGREEFTITESSVGYKIDEDQLEQQLSDAILAGTGKEIEIVPEVVQPQITTEELQDAGERVAAVSTSLMNSSADRTSNVRRALSEFDCMVVEPGMKVSFNGTVGARTEANGFKEAPEYAGDTVTTGIGGGVCQASTTLYNAILIAGLTPVERSRHSMTVGYVKASLDAAVTDTGKDLVFRNDTEYRYYIFTEVIDKQSATVTIYGKKPPYKIELDSDILETYQHKNPKYIKDYSGTHAIYVDESDLIKAGKDGVKSIGYRIYKDWETGEEVKRETLSKDSYNAERWEYWIGVTPRDFIE